jgi:hypothetical protein
VSYDDLYTRIKESIQLNNINIEEKIDIFNRKCIFLSQINIRIYVLPVLNQKDENKISIIGITKKNTNEADKIIKNIDKILQNKSTEIIQEPWWP